MSRDVTKRRIKGIQKALSYDYQSSKERKKLKRIEKATRKKEGERHRSKQQEIEELVEHEIELEGEGEL